MANTWFWPVPGNHAINQEFGVNGHTGLDIDAALGDEIDAVLPGTVYFAGSNDEGYGNLVILSHETDDFTGTSYYGHLEQVDVTRGDKVEGGDRIGKADSTGNSTGNHLHLEIRPNGGSPVDPMIYLDDAKEGGGGYSGAKGLIGDLTKGLTDWLENIKWTNIVVVIAGMLILGLGIYSLANEAALKSAGAAVGEALGDTIKQFKGKEAAA